MENERLRRFLRLIISNIQLECIKVEIDYPSAQISDPERQGMVAAFTEVSTALANILGEESIQPSLMKLYDRWFDRLMSAKERPATPFEIGYVYALRQGLGDPENLWDE